MFRFILLLATLTIFSVTNAFGAEGSREGGFGFLSFLFLGFLAMIVAWQLLPGLAMFGATLKGLFQGNSGQDKSSLTKR